MSYLIKKNRVENILIKCNYLLTQNVIDSPKFSTKKKIKKNYPSYIKECHSSFKKAEDILIKEILRFEDEIELLKKKKLDNSNKRKKKLLEGLKLLLELYFNTFVWIALHLDRLNVKRIFKGPKLGSLRHQNVDSVLRYVTDINKNPNEFAIPLDFCSFSPISDILKITYNEDEDSMQLYCTELKSGKVNEEMLETISSGKDNLYYKFFDKYGEKGIKQMKRFFRQQMAQSRHWDLIDAEPGGYESPTDSEKNLLIVADDSLGEFYTNDIIRLMDAADQGEYAVDIIDDCLIIGVISNKNAKIASLGDFDTRLLVYNVFINPKAWRGKKCPSELVEDLKKIQLRDWRNGFMSVIFYPLAIRPIPERFLMDLLFGRKKLVFYFNAESFISLCERENLAASFSSIKHAARLKSKGWAKGIPEFNGRFICFSRQDIDGIMGEGIFHDMFYNWLRPKSIIEREKSFTIPKLKQ